jgi:SNF2 family DNA or RNA helicase
MFDLFVPVEAEGYESTDWQEEDLEYLVPQEYSANWSEMGCYKTTTGIWLAKRRLESLGPLNFVPRLLIITSRNGKGTYYDAIPKTLELDGWRFFDVTVNGVTERVSDLVVNKWEIGDWKEYVEKVTEPHVVLTHYHCYTNKNPARQWLQRLDYTMCIVDEAHRIKNKDGQWTRHIKNLAVVDLKHVMTGTGFVNKPSEIWSLLNFLDPVRWGSLKHFKNEFVDEYIGFSGYIEEIGVKRENRQEFRALVRSLGPRRMMREVHQNIKEPLKSSRDVDLNPTQRAMYDSLVRELMALDQKGTPIYSPNVLSLLNRCRQVTVATPEKTGEHFDFKQERMVQHIKLVEPSSKLDEFMDLLDELRWDDEVKQKVVVFSQFKDPLELLKARLDKKQIPYIHMQEHHSDEERYRLWHDLWPEPTHRVFMSTLDLGGESINLTPGQYCVFLDQSWSPRANNQAIGRVYRPGQTEAVELIYLHARKTTDQRILKTNERKNGWFQEIFGDDPDYVPPPEDPPTVIHYLKADHPDGYIY